MFNPAYPFTAALLDSFIEKEVYHFVKSTYPRGLDTEIQEAYLISHYHAQPEAQRHFNVLGSDKKRDIYDLQNSADLERIRLETLPQHGYQSFSKLIHPEYENRANARFKDNTRRYLFKNTAWDLSGRVTIFPKFRFQLGELFVRIYHEGDQLIIPFKDIENS